MTVILFGANGQLGRAIAEAAEESGVALCQATHAAADLTDAAAVENAVLGTAPMLAINAAAYTAVDQAEDDPNAAYAVNTGGAENLARACRSAGIPLIHLSTDFVFDGLKTAPYVESDPVNPLGIYGKSKALGEERVRQVLKRHIIIRTAWLYGVHGRNFVKTIIRSAMSRPRLTIVSDQFGSPTSAHDLAGAVLAVAGLIRGNSAVDWGTYHYAGTGIASWYDVAAAVIQEARTCRELPPLELVPVTSLQYPARARRPRFSALNTDKIKSVFGVRTRHWREGVKPVVRRVMAAPDAHLLS